MPPPKEELPSHLRHIDKKSAETQKLIERLKGTVPDTAPPAPKRPAQPLARERKSAVPEANPEADAFLDRLDAPYVTYGEARRDHLRGALRQARAAGPSTLAAFLQTENEALDQLETAWKAKQAPASAPAADGAARPGWWKRLQLWIYKVQHGRDFADGEPSAELYDWFQVRLRSVALEILPVTNQICERMYWPDFFSGEDTAKADPRAYHLLGLLSSAHLAKALEGMESAEGEGGQSPAKIESLKPFVILWLRLTRDPSRKEIVLGALKKLEGLVADTAALSKPALEHLRLRPDDLKALQQKFLEFTDPGTLPKIVSLFANAMEEIPDRARLEAWLQVPSDLPAVMILTPPARAHAEKRAKELRAVVKKAEDVRHGLDRTDRDLELARLVFQAREKERATAEKRLPDDDPLTVTNQRINLFLAAFEEHLAENCRWSFEESAQGTWPMLADLKMESIKSLASFPIKQDLLGKIRRPLETAEEDFRDQMFDPTSPLYQRAQAALDYVRRINGRIALHFAQLFDQELRRLRDQEFDRLLWRPKIGSLRAKAAAWAPLGPRVPLPDGSAAPHAQISTDKFGAVRAAEPDSLGSILRLGRAILTGIAWDLREPGLVEGRRTKAQDATKDREAREQLDVLERLLKD